MALPASHGYDVAISRLSKRYKAATALDEVSLTVEAGTMVALLGPSGCGKTTLLRLIAGLDSPTSGSVRFDETPIADAARGIFVPAERRNIGMVFQDYALWPHMRVRDNVGFPLRARRAPKDSHGALIEAALRRVGLETFAERFPGQLSGGQQQRVALARATVDTPRLLLFDEPLSNLDTGLRESLGREIGDLVRQLGATAIYVTHDQNEALSLADRVAVMRDGRILHVDGPQDLFQNPIDLWTARFLKSGNLVAGDAANGAFRPRGASEAIALPSLLNGHSGPMTLLVPGGALKIGVEPAEVQLFVAQTQFRGDRHEILARWGDPAAGPVLHFSHDRPLRSGERVPARMEPTRLRIFETKE